MRPPPIKRKNANHAGIINGNPMKGGRLYRFFSVPNAPTDRQTTMLFMFVPAAQRDEWTTEVSPLCGEHGIQK